VRALDIDFRRAGHARRVGGVVLLVAGVCAAGVTLWQFEQTRERAAGIETILRRANAALRPPPPVELSPAEQRRASLAARRANDVVATLNVPWPRLFAALEAVNTQDSALLEIESDLDKRRLKIGAEARNLKAMLEYVQALEAQPVLESVQFQTHSTQQQDPQRPIRFSLSADWVDRK
jgi:hypothetical protein